MIDFEWKIIDISESNIDEYGLLCQKSKKKEKGYQDKLEWIKDRFGDGLKYKLLLVEDREKLTSRGFIEYIPGEYCWRGVNAACYMFIHCIWIVGKYKGFGLGSKLLEECYNDAKEMNGVAVMTAGTTWLPKSKLFTNHGFEIADSYPPSFELYVKQFKKNAPLPKFNSFIKSESKGLEVVYTNQCPYTYNMVRSIEKFAANEGVQIKKVFVDSYEDAQRGVHPYGTSCYLYNGQILTYHSNKISKLMEENL